jgi:hypothetical protein
MTPARRVPLIAAVLLVMSVSTASAECAWVLWITTYSGFGSVEHRIDAAYPELAACVARMKKGGEVIAGMQESMNRMHPDERGGRFVSLEATSLTVYEKSVPKNEWRCLPDTIDPRGPKASGR